VRPDQDLGGAAFEISLQPDGIVASVKDEQGWFTAFAALSGEAAHLRYGRIIAILIWRNTTRVHRGDPRVAGEADLGDELVGPASDDGLSVRVPGWMVVISSLGAALGIAAGPGR